MKILPLYGTQVWTVKANALIADAYICFDCLKVPKNFKVLEDKAEGFMEQEFLFPSPSSSAHVGFAIMPTFSPESCLWKQEAFWMDSSREH